MITGEHWAGISTVDLGRGHDLLAATCPVASVTAALGDDSDYDLVYLRLPATAGFVPGEVQPHVYQPVGTRQPPQQLALSQVRSEDDVLIQSFSGVAPQTLAQFQSEAAVHRSQRMEFMARRRGGV